MTANDVAVRVALEVFDEQFGGVGKAIFTGDKGQRLAFAQPIQHPWIGENFVDTQPKPAEPGIELRLEPRFLLGTIAASTWAWACEIAGAVGSAACNR